MSEPIARSSSAMVAIRSTVRNFIKEIPAGETILVACSGGADSLALAKALSREVPKFALNLVAVTIDHQLQAGSREQAERVAEQCREMGIATTVILPVRVEVTDGLEASARRARYEALTLASQNYGEAKVFLGHTQNDQAESVLLGLARGSGTRSMSGMARQSGIFIRPLLSITRGETEAACREVGLEPWKDPHNEDLSFLRVRARKQAIPALEESIGPGISSALARSAALLRDDADALDGWASDVFSKVDPKSLDVESLAGLPRAVRTRVIRLALYQLGVPPGTISADHVGAVEALFTHWRGQGEVSLPGGVKVVRLSGRLSLLPASIKPADPSEI